MGVRFERWNALEIMARPALILEDFGAQVADQAQEEIKAVKYDWPNATRRKNGKLVLKGQRDIVDTGALLRSQSAPVVVSTGVGATLRIEWTADYSGRVLVGGDYGSYVNAKGKVVNVGNKPGRDWIANTLQAKPFLPYLVQRWQQLATGG